MTENERKLVAILHGLSDKWRSDARNMYLKAAKMTDDPSSRPTGRAFVEYGSRRIGCCALELDEIIKSIYVENVSTVNKVNQRQNILQQLKQLSSAVCRKIQKALFLLFYR